MCLELIRAAFGLPLIFPGDSYATNRYFPHIRETVAFVPGVRGLRGVLGGFLLLQGGRKSPKKGGRE